MKLQNLTIALMALLVFSSCNSIRSISKKDSASSSTTLKKAPNSGRREFLNGMEVTPGGVVAGKKNTASNKKNEASKVTVSQERPGAGIPNSNIEDADMLQLKYAIATDATVEKLTNIHLLRVIDKWWGTRYCMGGSTDGCIDCSAFTQIILKDVYNVSLPRTSQEQFDASDKIELEDMREGDLVFFYTGGRDKDISHVGVYLLNNKFVHAATSGGVMISDLNEKYWQPKFRGAGRISKSNEVKGDK